MPNRPTGSREMLSANPETHHLVQAVMSVGRGGPYAVAVNIGKTCRCGGCYCCAAYDLQRLITRRTRGKK